MRLSELFTISTGYTFRDAIGTLQAGSVGVIQAGDINSAQLATIPRVQFANDKHMLREGDLLISARGRIVARSVTSGILPAIAASSVFVLRPLDNSTNTRYVAQYLNSASGQALLAKSTSGAAIRTLNKQALAAVDIPIVDRTTQEVILGLSDIINEQQQLLRLKQQLLSGVWNSAIANITKGTKA